jgi:hypothetical protein
MERRIPMSKKQYIMSIIEKFQQYAGREPDRLHTLLQQIQNRLASIPEETLENKFNMVVSSTADQQRASSENLFYLLQEAYSEMERIAKSSKSDNQQLLSAVNQLRGFLEVPDRYFP